MQGRGRGGGFAFRVPRGAGYVGDLVGEGQDRTGDGTNGKLSPKHCRDSIIGAAAKGSKRVVHFERVGPYEMSEADDAFESSSRLLRARVTAAMRAPSSQATPRHLTSQAPPHHGHLASGHIASYTHGG